MTTKNEAVTGTYVQKVSVTFEVVMDGDFGMATNQDVQAAAERQVRAVLGTLLVSATTDIYAQRGPGGGGFFITGRDAPITAVSPLRMRAADIAHYVLQEADRG